VGVVVALWQKKIIITNTSIATYVTKQNKDLILQSQIQWTNNNGQKITLLLYTFFLVNTIFSYMLVLGPQVHYEVP